MTAFVMSLLFIFLAELGDKSMLLAMAFATRFSWQTVLGGVFCATLLNHLLVVCLGTYLTQFVSLEHVNLFCSLAFIGFGLWTIRGDILCEDTDNCRFSPFWTVAIAFFLSEMGDKTQLATLTLAAEYNNLWAVWFGTTIGMTLADASGIILGIVLGKNIPESFIKWFAAVIFILFGLWGFYSFLPVADSLRLVFTASLACLVAVLAYLVRRKPEDFVCPVQMLDEE